jgi:hypothetical protein
MTSLRPELLSGHTVMVAGDRGGQLTEALAALGAAVVQDRSAAGSRALVYDARPAFAAGGDDGLRVALEDAWQAVGEVANASLIPADQPAKIVLIAPRPGAGAFAQAARAGLENLARTLSVEWARYGVTAVMVAPSPAVPEPDLVELLGFLCSEAGEYFSGCRLELGSPRR